MEASQTHAFQFVKQQIALLITIAIALCFAFLKLKGLSVNQTLWAEDGTVFINQARELGFSSLFVTYAGYFHAYPRLIAWISSFFDLEQTPLIFLSAWFLAYISLIYVATNRLLKCELAPLSACIIVIFMLAQPHSGEVFFTLTNAQWFTGAALAIYVLIPVKDTSSNFEKTILLIASLTGPFSLVLTPVLMLQLVIYKDWESRKYIYIILALGTLVQFSAILLFNRFGNGGFDHDIHHWMTAFYNFMSFGFKPAIPKIAAILFWITFVCALVLTLGKKWDRSYSSIKFIVLFLLVGAALFWCAALLAEKGTPQFLSPKGHGARYFFIPYILILFAAGLLVSQHTKLRYVNFFVLIILTISAFRVHQRDDLQFNSFVNFAKYNSSVLIPINPQQANFPGWHIRLLAHSKSTDSYLTPFSDLHTQKDIKINDFASELNHDSNMVINIQDQCLKSSYIGIELEVNRSEEGAAQIYWSSNTQFVDSQSLHRYYPKGNATMQFAFPRKNVKYIRFNLAEGAVKFSVSSAKMYCLAD